MSIPTPPSTTLSAPASPTELPTSNLPPVEHSGEESKMLSPSAKRIIKTTTTVVTPIFLRPKPVYIVVATSLNPPMGIGYQGKLPWPSIKADMAFFKQITSYVPANDLSGVKTLNAVVMGRKTWESIPANFRPLAGRLNVIITRGSSSDLGKRILEEMKGKSSDLKWELHQLPAKVRIRSKAKSTEETSTTVLLPLPSASSSGQTISPILISQSISSALSMLAVPGPISLSTTNNAPTSTPPTVNPTGTSSSLSISIHKIFCIGGAEIYRRVLALSSHTPRTPRKSTGPGTSSETGTDTEGEVSSANSHQEAEAFDVRILQTQIRVIPGKISSSASAAAAAVQNSPFERRKSKVEPPDFDCDTYFPDLLPGPGSRVKSGKWKPVLQAKMQDWIGQDLQLPQHEGRRKESIQDEATGAVELSNEDDESADEAGQPGTGDDGEGKELWLRDDKAGVEIRVVGWERR